MKLSEIAAALRAVGVAPVKSLGQNFLHDRNLAKSIVEQANIGWQDLLTEIRPAPRPRAGDQRLRCVHVACPVAASRGIFTKSSVECFSSEAGSRFSAGANFRARPSRAASVRIQSFSKIGATRFLPATQTTRKTYSGRTPGLGRCSSRARVKYSRTRRRAFSRAMDRANESDCSDTRGSEQ